MPYTDFDFARKRFSGEFLWHDSVEASEHIAAHGQSPGPVCWAQLGYASGYASHFFNTLIVYKQTQRAAAGHKHCRVIGKSADIWGAADPDVTLFHDYILSRETPLRPLAAPAKPGKTGLSDLDALILAPVIDRLYRLCGADIPVLICGLTGTGKQRAARYLKHQRHRATHKPKHLGCAGLTPEALEPALSCVQKTSGRTKSYGARSVVLDGIEALSGAAQACLIRHLDAARDDASARGHARIIATTCFSFANLRLPPGIDAGLILRLAAYPITLPDFAARRKDIGAIAQPCVDLITARCNANPVKLPPQAIVEIEKTDLPDNLVELECWLMAAVLSGQDITASLLRDTKPRADKVAAQDRNPDKIFLAQWISDRLSAPGLDLAAVEDRVLQAAVDKAGGNLTAAARLIGLSRPQLADRLDRTRHSKA